MDMGIWVRGRRKEEEEGEEEREREMIGRLGGESERERGDLPRPARPCS